MAWVRRRSLPRLRGGRGGAGGRGRRLGRGLGCERRPPGAPAARCACGSMQGRPTQGSIQGTAGGSLPTEGLPCRARCACPAPCRAAQRRAPPSAAPCSPAAHAAHGQHVALAQPGLALAREQPLLEQVLVVGVGPGACGWQTEEQEEEGEGTRTVERAATASAGTHSRSRSGRPWRRQADGEQRTTRCVGDAAQAGAASKMARGGRRRQRGGPAVQPWRRTRVLRPWGPTHPPSVMVPCVRCALPVRGLKYCGAAGRERAQARTGRHQLQGGRPRERHGGEPPHQQQPPRARCRWQPRTWPSRPPPAWCAFSRRSCTESGVDSKGAWPEILRGWVRTCARECVWRLPPSAHTASRQRPGAQILSSSSSTRSAHPAPTGPGR